MSVSVYLESLRVRSYAADTVKSHELSIIRFFEGTGVSDVREVTREEVRRYAAALCGARRFTVGTVRVRLMALKSFFGWLQSNDMILINPCTGL